MGFGTISTQQINVSLKLSLTFISQHFYIQCKNLVIRSFQFKEFILNQVRICLNSTMTTKTGMMQKESKNIMKKGLKEKATSQILVELVKIQKCKRLQQLHLEKNMNNKNQVDKMKIGISLKERNKSKLLLEDQFRWLMIFSSIMISSNTPKKIMKSFCPYETLYKKRLRLNLNAESQSHSDIQMVKKKEEFLLKIL